jgi:hypothetical protein
VLEEDAGDLPLAQRGREPVGAEQEDVALLRRDQADVHLHRLDDAQRSGEPVPAVRELGPLREVERPPDAVVGEDVILGQAIEAPCVEQVRAAVAHVRDRHAFPPHERAGEGRPHAALRRVALGGREDPLVGLLDGRAEEQARRGPRVAAQCGTYRGERQRRGYAARGSAADPVGDDEEAELGEDGERVLVVGVGPASTAEARGFDVQGSRQGNPSAIARAIGQTVEAAAWTALAGDAERGRGPREIEDLPGHRGGDDLGRAGRRDDLVVAAERDDRLQEADALGGLDVQLGLVDEHDRVLEPEPLERQREEHALLLARAQLFEVEHGPVAPREAKAVALALRLDPVERLPEEEGALPRSAAARGCCARLGALPSRPTLPVAVERAYDVWLWLDARVADFPTYARHSIGARILDAAIDLLDAYLCATYAPARSEEGGRALVRANQRLALLRLLLRGARERRYLSVAQHEHVAECLAELGRMTGAWLKHATGGGA